MNHRDTESTERYPAKIRLYASLGKRHDVRVILDPSVTSVPLWLVER